MSEKILLKDSLFNEPKIAQIAREIHCVYPSFQKDNFLRDVVQQFPNLELKARISWIAQCLEKYLPKDYKKAVEIILNSLPKANDPDLLDNDFGDFIYAPYAQYVALKGCNKNDLFISLNAIYQITQRFSAEYAIRNFINVFPKETLAELQKWTKDDHYHVRRLCSEGTRPKLPWAQKINISLVDAMPILDEVFYDRTRYVTRSVANHINDISKIDPDLAIDTLLKWKKSKKQTEKEIDYIIRHGLRSLIKQGNAKAMMLLGISPDLNIEILDLEVPKKVKLNDVLEFSFSIKANENAKIIVDYIIHFCNKAGNINRRKIFKLKNFSLTKDKKFTLTKRHLLRENMTTRKIFCGQHEIEIKINGKSCAKRMILVG